LNRVGIDDDTLKVLGVRDGIAFYAARSATGRFCFGTGSAAGSARSFEQLACRDFGDRGFPSPRLPVADLSTFHGQVGDPNLYLLSLTGVAADGVAKVGFLDGNGERYTTPVVNNVYADRDPPQVPVSALIALDHDGREVWRSDRLPRPRKG
jgi:hypothetical protein